MRSRSIALVGLAVVAVIASACSSAATQVPGLKIGLVTDVGSLNDKNFNQYSWEGAQDGASKIGSTAQSALSQVSADIGKNIQSFVDQKYDIIVTVGIDVIRLRYQNVLAGGLLAGLAGTWFTIDYSTTF